MPTSRTGPQTVSRKALAVLSVLVLLIHILLLQDDARVLKQQPALPAAAFSTRSVAPVAPDPPALRPPTQTQTQTPAPTRPLRKPTRAAEPTATRPDVEASRIPADASTAAAQAPEAGTATLTPSAPERAPRDAASPVHSYRVPGAAKLQYEVKGSKLPYPLNAELLWQPDGTRYDARLSFHAGVRPVMRQTSRGEITAQGLAPLRFSDKKRSEVAAHFVREQGKITFSANSPDAPLLDGAQDRLSLLLQLAAMMAGKPEAYPPASTLALQVVGPRDADLWLFTVENMETLALPGGEQSALKLQRNPRRAFDQKVELWLAPSLGYLPVRVRITDASGDFLDQQWLSGQLEP